MNTDTQPYYRVFGITGIIGSGKTTVCDFLEKMGAHVIRADELSARVLRPDYKNFSFIKNRILEILKDAFPSEKINMLFPENILNRKLLGEMIFSSAGLTRQINELVHPEVRRLFEEEVRSIRDPRKIIVYDVPLLYETGLDRLLRKSIVVYLEEQPALERAALRLNLDPEEVKKRMSRQISIEKKRSMADYVLYNTGDLQHLKEEVARLWKYLQDQI